MWCSTCRFLFPLRASFWLLCNMRAQKSQPTSGYEQPMKTIEMAIRAILKKKEEQKMPDLKDVSVIFCLYSLLGYYSFTVLLNLDPFKFCNMAFRYNRPMQRKILKYLIEYNIKNISTLIRNIIISVSKMSKIQFV